MLSCKVRSVMALQPGTRIGPYEVLSLLGAGGMGEVYKARDSRLNRTVALKTLPPAGDRARFELEARAVAALNHPNVVAVYDVGDNYIVSELVDGSPLPSPASPLKKLLDLAVQIADGLAAAHAAGIIHRDLKPANILMTRDGRVKILDFGLAKTVAPGAGAGSATLVETQITTPGMIVGTAAYMSPEQARGAPLDLRSDQFSLGVILYEMASGKRAFERDTMAETMTAILREEVEPLPSAVPAPLRWIIGRCLAKEPAGRYDSTRDLYQELRTLREHFAETTSSAAVPLEAPAAPSTRARWLVVTAAIASALLLAAASFWIGRRVDAFEPRLRFTPVANDPAPETHPVFSPDGRSIAYTRGTDNDPFSDSYQQILIRVLDAPTPTVLVPAVPSLNSLGWSADGSRILYRTPSGELWSVTVSGGTPQKILEGLGGGFAESPDGKLLLTTTDLEGPGDPRTGFLVSAPPGSPLRPVPGVSVPSETGPARDMLEIAPDSSRFALPCGTAAKPQLCVVEYPSGSTRVVATAGPSRSVAWLPDSRHALVNDRGSMRVFDTRMGTSHELLGTQEVLQQSTLSPDGARIIYSTGTADYHVVQLSLDGQSIQPLIESSLQNTSPHLSPLDGSVVYLRNFGSSSELWTLSTDGARNTLLVKSTNGPQSLGAPRFSPNGRTIAYADGGKLFTILAGGGKPVEIYAKDEGVIFGLDWSPDGAFIAVGERVGGDTRLLKVPSGGGAPATVPGDGIRDFYLGVRWSPDGRWIAGVAPEGVQLVSPDGKQERMLTDRASAGDFSPDGQTYYALRRGEKHFWIVVPIDVATGREATPRTLPVAAGTYVGSMSLNRDGKRMVVHVNELKYDLWMIEGFPRPARGLQALWRNWVNP
jgi:serine/threonine protein kinase